MSEHEFVPAHIDVLPDGDIEFDWNKPAEEVRHELQATDDRAAQGNAAQDRKDAAQGAPAADGVGADAQKPAGEGLTLEAPTPEALQSAEDRAKAAEEADAADQRSLAAKAAAETRRKNKAEEEARAKQVRKERADAAVDGFQLGQEPPSAQVSHNEAAGQGDVFAAAEQPQPVVDAETAATAPAAALSQAPAPINALTLPEAAIKSLAGKTIAIPVRIAETGETGTLTMDAAEAVKDIQQRHAAAQKLLECV